MYRTNFYKRNFLIFALITALRSEEVKLQQKCDCSMENFSADLASGIFKSPMFPRHYCDNLQCIYEIEAKQNSAIALVVEYFDTETSHDYVEIYQTVFNETFGYQFIKQHILTGQAVIQRHFYSAFGGGLRLVFITDATESGFAGFQMSFNRFEENSRRNSPCPQPLHFAKAKVQLLPELASNFRTDSLCAFFIKSTEAVQITVKSLAPSLTLKIYELENFNSKRPADMLESLNGFAVLKLPQIITSRTPSLTIIVAFSSMSHATFNHSYEIEYTSSASVCNCPAGVLKINFNAAKSFISPGFPLEYCDLANCTTRVFVASGNHPHNISITPVIRVKLEKFRLEIDVDYLDMIDKRSLIALTGIAREITYFTFDHSEATLNFISDHSVTELGFNITLEVYQKPYYCQCPGSPQILQEEKYSQNYTFEEKCRFLDCFWEIRCPNSFVHNKSSRFRIILKILFQFEAPTEFIELSKGANLERNNERLKLDSTMIPDNGIAERSIEFEALDYVSIWYHREGDLMENARFVDIEYEWRQKCLCGNGDLKAKIDEWQQITSPDYPMSYCNGLSCAYHITAREGNRIVLNVSDFFTEINQDFLMIFDGNSTSEKHLEMLSGIELFTNLICSTGNSMSLLFITDLSLSMRGFALWYKAEKTLSPVEAENKMNEENNTKIENRASLIRLTIFGLLLIIIGLIIYVVHLNIISKPYPSDITVRFRRMQN